MKRWWMVAALAAAALTLMPSHTADVGELLPVELLYVDCEQTGVRVETDTGEMGYGEDLAAALSDLKAAAPGRVFLETADYLVVTREAAYLLPQLRKILRPATRVCLGVNTDAGAADYLSAHKPEIMLKDVRPAGQQLPVLMGLGERYRLVSEGNS